MERRHGIGQQYGADLAALLVVGIWGINFVFMKAAFAQFDVLAFTFLRYTGMLVLGWSTLLWLYLRRRRPGARSVAIDRADRPRIVLAGVLGFSFYMLLSAVGLGHTTAFANALLLAIAPLFMALFLWLLRLEAVGTWRWFGMLVSLAGAVIFLLAKRGGGAAELGDLLSLLAAVCYAAYVVVNKPLAMRYSAPVLTTYTMTAGSVPVLLLTLPALLSQHWGRVTPVGWIVLAWATVFPVFFAWSVWSWVNTRLGVGRSSLFMFLVPVISGITGRLLLDEGFGLQGFLGAALVLGGLAVARRAAAAPAALPFSSAVRSSESQSPAKGSCSSATIPSRRGRRTTSECARHRS
ncbi:MAG: DMT family transporter [Dehalococcoidia bacterium]